MKNNIFYTLSFLFAIVFSTNAQNYEQIEQQSNKIRRVMGWASLYYVDSVDEAELAEAAIVGMLKELDPHSVYISKEEVEEMNAPLEGSFEGIGIQFNIFQDTILVVATIPGGPSHRIGIKAGDRIVKVEGENVAGVGINTQGVRDRLMGKKGTKVDVSIKRKGVKRLLEFTITRDEIPIHSVEASYKVNDDIGYIKLNRFAATSMEEFKKALEELQDEGINSLILDLQDNGGGYLNTAIDLADEFLERDKMIVYTKGLNSPKSENYSTKKGEFEKGKLVVLIDEGSASASEIVAGAVQDWDRGLVIGRRSFGKGLVQRAFPLPDGAMIRLTIARYYTPTGRCIQKPYDKGTKEYGMDILHRYNHGELTSEDSIHFPDSLKYKTLKNERTVYGGGGIMPDIFVPLDTTLFSDYHFKLLRNGIINEFVINYVDNHRKELKNKYASFDDFNKTFEVTREMLNRVREKGKKHDAENGNEPDKEAQAKEQKDFEEGNETMALHIKALIARDIWTDSEYYKIMNQVNPLYLRAIEILQNPDKYKNNLKK